MLVLVLVLVLLLLLLLLPPLHQLQLAILNLLLQSCQILMDT
jgi:hypothetical protein